MAIDYLSAEFLLKAKTLGTNFRRTLTLGRLNLYASTKELPLGYQAAAGPYADALLRMIGGDGSKVTSLDASNYEGASIIHDLNLPIPEWMGTGRFDTIIDGGTLEHIYDVRQALSNCNRLLETGGHFIGISPANNYCGHGFYQFSPEFWFSTFCVTNGYVMRYMELVEYSPIVRRWIVRNPADVGRRVELRNRYGTLCLFVAKKIHNVAMTYSQQSDYVTTWEQGLRANRFQGLRQALLNTAPGLARMAERFAGRFARP